jgi:SAM-dependent methyltransferase
MQSSQQLYTALAHRYREHFESPHRRAYDAMAWDRVRHLLPGRGPIVDAGCGVGRWAERLLALGYEVIGIEPAPGMITELRRADHGQAFKLITEPMEAVQLPDGSAGMVLALGSLQYSADPEAMVRRFAGWVRPGGPVMVLVDSLVALVIELLRDEKYEEAMQRLRTRIGVWAVEEQSAEMHLMDQERLRRAFQAAGLADVQVTGLLATAAPLGPARLADRLEHDWDAHLVVERELQAHPVLADIGKQLLATGRRTSAGTDGPGPPRAGSGGLMEG